MRRCPHTAPCLVSCPPESRPCCVLMPSSQGSHVLAITSCTEWRAGRQWAPASCDRGFSLPLSIGGHQIPISCFLSWVIKLNFTYQQHSRSNKEAPACGARSNSTTQWASSPAKSPRDNPIINIHSLFFRLIFKSITTEKVRNVQPPQHYIVGHLNGLFCCVKKGVIRRKWRVVPQRLSYRFGWISPWGHCSEFRSGWCWLQATVQNPGRETAAPDKSNRRVPTLHFHSACRVTGQHRFNL